MLEARTFVESLDDARNVLAEQNAIFKGEYTIHNYIYKSKDLNKTLMDEFLRLRIIPQNIWDEKPVVVAIKNTELKTIGKNSIIPLKEQFDTEGEGRKYIEENLMDRFVYDFEFSCMGWQYNLGEDQVDLEDIEGHFSVEIKSKNEEGIVKLVKMFDIQEVIIGPTVVAVKKLLKK